MLYEKMLFESKQLEEQIQSIHTKLSLLSSGKLICARNGSRYKWYHSDGKNSTYIPKSNRELAEQLAIKKVLICTVKRLTISQKSR